MSFGLGAFCLALLPSEIGSQDLAALIARQPEILARPHAPAATERTSWTPGTLFGLPQASGASAPLRPIYQLANFDPRSLDISAARRSDSAAAAPEIVYPTVNRQLKGDRLPTARPTTPENLPQLRPIKAEPNVPQSAEPQHEPADAQPEPPASPELVPATAPDSNSEQPSPTIIPAKPPRQSEAEEPAITGSIATATPDAAGPSAADNPAAAAEGSDGSPDLDAGDETGAADRPPELPEEGSIDPMEAAQSYVDALSFLNDSPSARRSGIYFGATAMGSTLGSLEPWEPGAEPVMVSQPGDPGIKLAALTPAMPESGPGGESLATKDDTGRGVRQLSPAQRLGLEGKARARAEKCLADAIYFESRGEPLRGQEAVAQVVMNRVFSGFYPSNVCGVVYQNANRHLACQFTFACDGRPDRVNEPEMWVQAKRIARDTLDGKIWLAEVGHATHYHAYWVHPSWVREMKKMYKLGVHTFYRPRAWGNGAEAPIWGAMPSAPKVEIGKPEPAVGRPEANAKRLTTAKL